MIYPATSTYQLMDPRLAAACMALGFPVRADIMEHVPMGSQERNKIHRTWHIGSTGGEESARELLSELASGALYRDQPAHPLFACLAGIDSFLALQDPRPLSLVPFAPSVFLAQRICALRIAAVNDGRLYQVCHAIQECPMDHSYAAVAAVAGFAFTSFAPTADGKYRVAVAPSLTFPELTLQHLLQAFMAAASQVQSALRAPSPLNPEGSVALEFALPGSLPGEHPAQYALAAVQIYQAFTGPRAQKPGTYLLTANFSAVVPVSIDTEEMDLTERFLTAGGSVFL